jgi:hypothetical protein
LLKVSPVRFLVAAVGNVCSRLSTQRGPHDQDCFCDVADSLFDAVHAPTSVAARGRHRRRRLLLHRPLGDDRKGHLLFVSGLLEFTVPLAKASGVYTLLNVWLRTTARTEAATTIATIEKTLAAIRNTYVKPFHLSLLTQLLLVLVPPLVDAS